MSVQQLPKGVIKLISSTQVINSVSSVVKELLENSIDAGATAVDIKLERNGLDKIEIRDNGSGINVVDIYNICLPNYTSKIHNFDDLEHLQSYGFRGEALHSLCAVSQVSITTKTQHDEVASTYTYDNNGTVRDVTSSHQKNGSIVTVTNLFRNVPVRKQYYDNSRKGSDELKKIEKIVKQLSIIHPKLRVTLAHNKCLIWHKTCVYSLRQSLMQVYPQAVLKNLEDVSCELENMSIEMLIAKRECNLSVLCQPISEAILLYINQRPVKDKKIEKIVLEEMNHLYASSLPVNKCPLTLISLKLSPESLDVNLEPNKTKVFIKDHEEILKQIRERIMLHFYQQPATDDLKSLLLDADELQNPPKKRKLESDDEDPKDYEKHTKGDSDVSKMRNLIIEKTNVNAVNAELALKELTDINFSAFEEDTNFTSSIETEKKNENIPDLVRNSEELKRNPQLENYMDDLNATSCTNLFDDTSSLVRNNQNESKNDLEPSNAEIRQPTTYKEIMLGDSNFNANCENIVSKQCGNATSETNIRNDSFIVETHRSGSPKNPILNSSNELKDITVGNIKSTESTTKDVTLSQWSRGHVTLDNNTVDSGVVLFNGQTEKRNFSDDREKSKKTAKVVNDDISQISSLNRSVTSQMGGNHVAGFTNFAHQIRSEIVKETPGMSFTKVAGELTNRLRNLHQEQKNSSKEETKLKQKPITSNINVMFKKKTLAMTVSVNRILEELKMPGSLCQRLNDSRIFLIGPLETGKEWLYKIGDDIKVVNVSHLRENVLLHRYICNSSIPLKHLDEPIKITSEILGDELWRFLLSLERMCDDDDECSQIIFDGRITKNGFKVVINKGDLDLEEVLISKIAKEADDFHVIENFIETLKLAKQFRELEQCRTDSIKKMLLDKVAEVCEQKSLPSDVTEIRMLLQYWVQCMFQKKICPHDDPISINVHRL